MIRDATGADAARIAAAVHAQPLLVRYGATEAGLARSIGKAIDAGERVLVADDGVVRGFAWFLMQGGLGAGGYLKLIATATGGEQRAVGRALLAAVEDELELRQLFLLVSDFNTAAQRFYEREGYARVGRLPAYVKPDIDELVYWKRLGQRATFTSKPPT